jgi:hypothetical protein
MVVIVGTWNVENLYRPGGEFGPKTEDAHKAKLAALAGTINRIAPDVLAVQEVGEPEALADLLAELDGAWHAALSSFPDPRGIRVGFLSCMPITVLVDSPDFPPTLAPLQADDDASLTTRMGRGALAVRVEVDSQTMDLACYHLKSKLLAYPGGRFSPHDEGERARYGAYALYRRAAEAVTVRVLANALIDNQGQTEPSSSSVTSTMHRRLQQHRSCSVHPGRSLAALAPTAPTKATPCACGTSPRCYPTMSGSPASTAAAPN